MSEFKNFWNLTLVTLAGGAEITVGTELPAFELDLPDSKDARDYLGLADDEPFGDQIVELREELLDAFAGVDDHDQDLSRFQDPIQTH